MVRVNEIIPTARKLIHAFSERVDDTQTELRDNVVRADAALVRIYELHEDFHDKIARFGPEEPAKNLGGHNWLIRQRSFGDGNNPNNCSRWFLKVSPLYKTTLAADIDLE